MKTSDLWLMVLGAIIVIAGGFYAWGTQTSMPEKSSITVASPQGGEAWQSGSTHTISWTTEGIPATDKISVSIRRIPPPPLQTEGQEFDPIIFTDLPNTGNVEWKIASMYPNGTYVLGIHAYKSVPVTNEVSTESAQFTISHPVLAQALYPLYKNADWNAPKVESFTISTSTYSGASVTSAPVTDTMDPAGVFSPFERYYDQKLKSLGWKVDNYLAAGGHVGGQTGYRKGSEMVLVRYSTLYHTVTSTAPSECPCDVTLSLFSAN